MNKQVMIGSVDFSGHEEMYETLYETTDEKTPKKYNKAADTYLIFDDIHSKVWIYWY